MNASRYETEKRRLAGLTRAGRFEELLDFPCNHLFKVIGAPEDLSRRVADALADEGHPDAVPVERLSKKGAYRSVSVEVKVESGAELDQLYRALERLEGVKYLF